MPAWMRRARYRIWRNGAIVSASFREPIEMKPLVRRWPAMSVDHVVGVDTESLRARGKLRTVLVSVAFARGGVLIEPKPGESPLGALLDLLIQRYGQRVKRTDVFGKRKTPPAALLTFYNLGYDIDRLLADRPDLLRAVAVGAESYRIHLGSFEIEIRRMHLDGAASFDLVVFDNTRRLALRLYGLDVSAYWKDGLDATAAALGVKRKRAINKSMFDRPRERFTARQWTSFRRYAAHDAKITREVYLRTAKVLSTIDPIVIRRNGVLPPSIAAASARIVFHGARGAWRRPPAAVEQLGCDAYYGGRAFCGRPGIYAGVSTRDIKSAHPHAMACLPDPTTCQYRFVGDSGFDVDEWHGRYGVLVIDGEGLDDRYPALRTRDDERLRYVVGRFKNLAATIPEIVIGVTSGALRVDRIRRGVWLDGKTKGSFLRRGVLRLFALKENVRGMRALAKDAVNALYGKLIEVRADNRFIDEILPMPCFKHGADIAASIARIYVDHTATDVYWGPSKAGAERARKLYAGLTLDDCETHADRCQAAAESYIRALTVAGEPYKGVTTLRDFLRRFAGWRCGHYFLAIFASQVSGLTSAKTGLMARCAHALAGDTDSVHLGGTPVVQRYYTLMKKAGYPQPRKGLGAWIEQTPPSVESVLVRPKVYSHRFIEAGRTCFKQAQHGLTRYPHGERDLHDALKTLVQGETISYTSRSAPRRRKAAIIGDHEVGEFIEELREIGQVEDPNTFIDTDGWVRWR